MRRYEFWLANIIGLSNCKKIQIHGIFKSAKDVYYADEYSLKSCNVLEEDDINLIKTSKEKWNVNAKYMEFLDSKVDLITYYDEAFPSILNDIDNCPYVIYFMGDISLLNTPCVSIVGARRCSAYGAHVSEELGYYICKGGYTLVSGMAKGVDGHSHIGALRANGKTIAVLGGAPNICYPPENRDIYSEILKHGLVIAEYPPDTKPMAKFFPARNRIISGLSNPIVVVEAKKKSGSLITADLALAQGRDIFVVPGRITDPMSYGCNELIRQGAGIISGYDTFLKELSIENSNLIKSHNNRGENLFLEKEESMVYACLDFYPKGIDEIVRETNLDLIEVLQALVNLCDRAIAKESFMNSYVKLK